MMIVLALLSVGTVVSALSSSLAPTLAGRVIQGAVGVGAGLFIPQRRPEAVFGPHIVGDSAESTS